MPPNAHHNHHTRHTRHPIYNDHGNHHTGPDKYRHTRKNISIYRHNAQHDKHSCNRLYCESSSLQAWCHNISHNDEQPKNCFTFTFSDDFLYEDLLSEDLLPKDNLSSEDNLFSNDEDENALISHNDSTNSNEQLFK